MKISCKFGEPSCYCFPLRALTPKISTRGGGGIANAKPKYPPDASGGYNKVQEKRNACKDKVSKSKTVHQ